MADRPRVYLSPPDMTDAERAALIDAFDGGWIAPVGPDLDAFERDLSSLTGRHAVALSSGTAALHLGLLAAGVGPGDRVFVSTFTFAATANAVCYCGADPVFIDSDLDSWNISPSLLRDALEQSEREGRLPKAVVTVDLYGQCADYAALVPICDHFGVALIEDAAEALGASCNGRPAGSFGASAALSFNGNKIITTSGGGAYLAPDEEGAQRARYLATQARQPAVHYEHTEVGFNYRLSNLLAAIGRAQLQRLPAMIERRRGINRFYRDQLADSGVSFMPTPSWSEWNGWLSCVVFAERTLRDRAMAALDAENIESRPLWKPLHLQPAFAGAAGSIDGTSEMLFERGLCLPSGSALSDADVARVASIIRALL